MKPILLKAGLATATGPELCSLGGPADETRLMPSKEVPAVKTRWDLWPQHSARNAGKSTMLHSFCRNGGLPEAKHEPSRRSLSCPMAQATLASCSCAGLVSSQPFLKVTHCCGASRD